jgi:quercetin dioxygenase-like cupin family protein
MQFGMSAVSPAVAWVVLVAIAVGAVVAPTATVRAQHPTGGAPHDARLFACLPDGLVGGATTGCQLLVRTQLGAVADGQLFWHLGAFPTRVAAEAARRPGDMLAEAAGQVWLFSFGPQASARTGKVGVVSVGPLPLPEATSYQVEIYYVVMPPGMHTVVHTHPGPEAWYILDGEQCLETPLGATRARAGEGAVAPPGGTPMRLTNNGSRARRALFIVIHDPQLSWSAASTWRPTGACDR